MSRPLRLISPPSTPSGAVRCRQVPLDKASRHLTNFLTPWGRFRCKRVPPGLQSAGDEFGHRSDAHFSHIGNALNIVDDILVHSANLLSPIASVVKILSICRTFGITLNKMKFMFAMPELPFAGYIVGASGVSADPAMIRAISHFPTPASLTDSVTSWVWLANWDLSHLGLRIW